MKLIRRKFTRRSPTKTQMENEEKQPEKAVGEMHKRRETMADRKRYIIYYTFGEDKKTAPRNEEVRENV